MWTDPEVYMCAAMAMSLGGAVLLMLIATGAMVSGQQSMTVIIIVTCSIVQFVCHCKLNQLAGIIITGNSDHYTHHVRHCFVI